MAIMNALIEQNEDDFNGLLMDLNYFFKNHDILLSLIAIKTTKTQ